MSNEPTEPTETPAEATEATDEAASTTIQNPLGARGPQSILTRPTDHAVRPGFRNPANQKSKAQKKKK